MSGTRQRTALASHRNAVAERIEAGGPFGDVEDSIDELADLSTDQKGRAVAARLRAAQPSRARATRTRCGVLPPLAMGGSEMNGQARQRDLGPALAAALKEQARAATYHSRPGQVRRGSAKTVDRPRPLEFDRNGFPIAQRLPSFVTRVARLLGA
jgi:hypothetical protein